MNESPNDEFDSFILEIFNIIAAAFEDDISIQNIFYQTKEAYKNLKSNIP